jgi:hypothetical protein
MCYQIQKKERTKKGEVRQTVGKLLEIRVEGMVEASD